MRARGHIETYCMHGWGLREEAQHHHGSSEERVRKKKKDEGGREGGSRSEHERDLERRTESQQTEEERRGVPSSCAGSRLCVVVWGVNMSSPCLLRATPISQPRLREVKISLKANSRETTAIRSITGGTKEGTSRPYAPAEKETPVRVSVSGSRSRSTPPVNRAQKPEIKKTTRGSSSKKHEPEHHPERNGTLLHVPLTMIPAGHSPFSSSSSSSSSCTPRRQRASHPYPPPAPLLSSSSSSSSAKSMKRARWLSYSTSNICFNSILEGRFRQLQGTGSWQSCVCVFDRESLSTFSCLTDDR